MAVFQYKASDEKRIPREGTIAAETPRQARDQLRARGLTVRSIAPHEDCRGAGGIPFWRRGYYERKVTTTIRELGTLVGVGIPVLEALETVSRTQSGKFLASLQALQDRVASGAGLAEAMSEQSAIYDELSVQMVELGEMSGNLDRVLNQLADFKERSSEFKDRVKSAVLYPSIVFVASIGVALFLMSTVVPMLLSHLTDAGRPLPWPTLVLKTISDALVDYGSAIAFALISGLIGAISYLRTNSGRRFKHGLLLRSPLIGTMTRMQAVARLAMVIATLLRSGIVLVKALELSARSCSNQILRDALDQARADIQTGREIGRAFEQTGEFPPLVIQVFSVGQQTGRLEEMLDRLAADYDRRVTVWSTRLGTILEPILILFLAVFVGFILLATVLPIMEAGNVL